MSTGDANSSINSGSAGTKIEMYDGGHIGVGAANCEQFDCTVTLTSAFLSGITSTGLTIGGTKTSNLYIGGLTEAATANVSGTVTLNAKFQGAWNAEEGRYSEIIFQHGLEAPDGNPEIYFKALTTNSTQAHIWTAILQF